MTNLQKMISAMADFCKNCPNQECKDRNDGEYCEELKDFVTNFNYEEVSNDRTGET